MNRARVLINVSLSLAAAAGGIALLLSDRWTWSGGEGELVFTGASLWLLGVGLLFLAGFVASIARDWALGEVEMPPGDAAEPHPAYQGRLMVRYWYLFGPALGCIAGALWLAA